MGAMAERVRAGLDTEPFFSGREVTFAETEIIVSKTDPRGMITYVNDVFMDISGYSEDELIGKPHSLIRHPLMPRCVFKLLWDTVKSGKEIFAYVVNQCKNGDYYWVLAHVTPTIGENGEIIGYHSNRRTPSAQALAAIRPLYAQLVAQEEQQGHHGSAAVEASTRLLSKVLAEKGVSYDKFVLSL